TAIMFVASFVTLIIAGISAGVMALRAADTEQLVERTIQIRQAADGITHLLQLAETSQRASLLPGSAPFLSSYRQAEAELHILWSRVAEQVDAVPDRGGDLTDLSATIERRLEALREGVSYLQSGDLTRARNPERLSSGYQLTVQIRDQLDNLASAEHEQLITFQAEAARLRSWLLALIAVSIAATIALALLVGRAIRHYIDRLKTRTAELEEEAKRRHDTEV